MPITLETAKATLDKFTCALMLGIPAPKDMVSIETIASEKAPSLIFFYQKPTLEEYLTQNKAICPITREELNPISKESSKHLFALIIEILRRKNLLSVIIASEDDDLRAILDHTDGDFLALMKDGGDLLNAIIKANGRSIEEKLKSIEAVLSAYKISVTPAMINFLTKTLGFDMADIKEFSEPKQQREAATIIKPTQASTTVTTSETVSTFPFPAFSQSKTDIKGATEAKITKEMEQFRLQNYLEEISENSRKMSAAAIGLPTVKDWAIYESYGYAAMWEINETYFNTHREKIDNLLLFHTEKNHFLNMLSAKRDTLFQSIKKLYENSSESPLSSVVRENNRLITHLNKQLDELSKPSALSAFVESSETNPARFFASQMPSGRALASSSSSSSSSSLR